MWPCIRRSAADFGKALLQLQMGSEKPKMVLRLFQEFGFQTIILADTDTVWLRDPTEYIASFPTADMMISTDCASAEAEFSQTPDVARCGQIPGAALLKCNSKPRTDATLRSGSTRDLAATLFVPSIGSRCCNAYNTGMLVLRNRPATRQIMQAWHDRMYFVENRSAMPVRRRSKDAP